MACLMRERLLYNYDLELERRPCCCCIGGQCISVAGIPFYLLQLDIRIDNTPPTSRRTGFHGEVNQRGVTRSSHGAWPVGRLHGRLVLGRDVGLSSSQSDTL